MARRVAWVVLAAAGALAVAGCGSAEPGSTDASEVQAGEASIHTLQSGGSGGWLFRIVVMKREGDDWRFDYSRDLGKAPAVEAPRSPVT
ncbi:MAG: hypothetical protein ACSLFF_10185 [Solirubrobacterales bacterium]